MYDINNEKRYRESIRIAREYMKKYDKLWIRYENIIESIRIAKDILDKDVPDCAGNHAISEILHKIIRTKYIVVDDRTLELIGVGNTYCYHCKYLISDDSLENDTTHICKLFKTGIECGDGPMRCNQCKDSEVKEK